MNSLSGHFRRNLLTGLLVIGPLGISIWVLYHLFLWIDHLLWERLRLSFLHEGGIPGVGFVFILLIVYLTGLFTANYIGGRVVRAWERLLLRIPLFNKVYLAAKQVGEAFLSPNRASAFRGVALLEFPRKGVHVIVFEVNSPAGAIVPRPAAGEPPDPGEAIVAVFMPTVPNPTTGNLLFVARRELLPLTLSMEDALKMVISGGTVAPESVTRLRADPPESVAPGPSRGA